MFFSIINYAATLFIVFALASTSLKASEPNLTPQFLNPISEEINLLKKNDPNIKRRYEIKNSSIKSMLNWIDKVYLIESRDSWESKVPYYFFLNIFPGYEVELSEKGGIILLNEQRAPRLHETVQKLCNKLTLPKPTIFLSADKKLFNAFAASFCDDLSMIVVGEKLLNVLSQEELESLLAHELAHVKKNHSPKKLAFIALSMALPFIIWNLLTPSKDEKKQKEQTFWQYLQSTEGKVVCTLAAIVGCEILQILCTRSFEEEADRTSIETTDNPDAFKAMIQKIENYEQEEFDSYNADYQFLREKIEELRKKHPRYAAYIDFFAKMNHQSEVASLEGHKESESGTHPSLKRRKGFADEYSELKKLGAEQPHDGIVSTTQN